MATATSEKKSIEVSNPATLERIREVPVRTTGEIRQTVARCREAQESWGALPLKDRIVALRNLRDLLYDRRDEIAEVISSETGKPVHEAISVEVFYSCSVIEYFCGIAPDVLATSSVSSFNPMFKTKKLRIAYRPHGVVGFITPWNFPFMFTCGDVIPALVAGNGVVIKPSEYTPLSALLSESLAAEVLPKNLLNVVPGYGEAGGTLIECVDYVAFTGSVATGKRVMERASHSLTPVSLELGGKDPFIVLADADLDRAAAAAVWGGFFNAGQACISVERVYVEEPVAEKFTKKVVAEVEKLRQGPSSHAPIDIGSMTTARQLSIVEDHVADAVKRGAKVLVGGKRNDRFQGYFYEPTVLANVTHEMKIMREETFGPVLPIMTVKDRVEALALANDSPYGLNASVFTRDRAAAEETVAGLQAGGVCINDCCVNYVVPELPMGGIRESGIGYRHSTGGLLKFCRQQAILEDRLGLKREPIWFPYTPGKSQLIRRAMAFLFRSGLRKKLFG